MTTKLFSNCGPMIELLMEHGYASYTTSDLSRSAICEYLSGFVVKKLKCIVKYALHAVLL
jgi:hypothetical protein